MAGTGAQQTRLAGQSEAEHPRSFRASEGLWILPKCNEKPNEVLFHLKWYDHICTVLKNTFGYKADNGLKERKVEAEKQ